ncbi:uncharacterized protein FHX37_0572 [Haloactinospora alba]|uniref:Metal-binding protein n=2 Tax=Haloactinospora alba TaxID=405555 RepID=A0A543NFZ3_9ACTN|nr:DUF177 domain-containing protein [Haloactinospora alba]TQN30690.1 uncharacterized protein FHX37_0572 [Haloactinospora alba]
MRTLERIAPAPGSLANGMVHVPEGADIALELRLEAVMEGVLVTGTGRTRYEGECSRCLDPVSDAIEVDFQELFRYPEEDSKGRSPAASESDAEDEEDEDYYLEDDLLDMEQVLRDALVLALPLTPLCRDDCPGLCVECGVKLAEAEPGHSHGDPVDPRWEPLRKLGGDTGEQ